MAFAFVHFGVYRLRSVLPWGQLPMIALSAATGEPTIAEQGSAADTERKTAAADHPLVRAIMAAFPGARIDTVHDKTADAYGLPATTEPSPDMPDFAPPDAAYFDDEPMEMDP